MTTFGLIVCGAAALNLWRHWVRDGNGLPIPEEVVDTYYQARPQARIVLPMWLGLAVARIGIACCFAVDVLYLVSGLVIVAMASSR